MHGWKLRLVDLRIIDVQDSSSIINPTTISNQYILSLSLSLSPSLRVLFQKQRDSTRARFILLILSNGWLAPARILNNNIVVRFIWKIIVSLSLLQSIVERIKESSKLISLRPFSECRIALLLSFALNFFSHTFLLLVTVWFSPSKSRKPQTRLTLSNL